ncbi:MAG: hypothetical protein VSS75_016630 [Candidatus Parabeggiatoa sp.]|nr:hypothetical protein [Candidatus Parabeggiatoa sp.]
MPKKEPTYLSNFQWGQIFAKAWTDPAFKKAFELNPRQAVEDNKALFGITDMTGISILQLPDNPGDIPDIQAVADGKVKLMATPLVCAC